MPVPSSTDRLLHAMYAVPALYFGTLVLAAMLYPGYNHMGQFASELGSHSARYPMVFNAGTLMGGFAGLAGSARGASRPALGRHRSCSGGAAGARGGGEWRRVPVRRLVSAARSSPHGLQPRPAGAAGLAAGGSRDAPRAARSTLDHCVPDSEYRRRLCAARRDVRYRQPRDSREHPWAGRCYGGVAGMSQHARRDHVEQRGHVQRRWGHAFRLPPVYACRSARPSFVEGMKGTLAALNQENHDGQQEHDLPLV